MRARRSLADSRQKKKKKKRPFTSVWLLHSKRQKQQQQQHHADFSFSRSPISMQLNINFINLICL